MDWGWLYSSANQNWYHSKKGQIQIALGERARDVYVRINSVISIINGWPSMWFDMYYAHNKNQILHHRHAK